mmetsp:Transcript_14796/g.23480  ORF Transcript_14796/g.23480 Transcript_14796/m.23480 type:complete len:135 (+) Transcript_14796:933-1337(+)
MLKNNLEYGLKLTPCSIFPVTYFTRANRQIVQDVILSSFSIICTVWCALDRMEESNGTLVFGSEDLEESKNIRIECEAGDCVLFHSSRIHSSGPNRSLRERRVAYAQYTPEPFLVGSKDNTPLSFAIACCHSKV